MSAYVIRRRSDGVFLGLFAADSLDQLSTLADELGDDGTSEYARITGGFGIQWCVDPGGHPLRLAIPHDEGEDEDGDARFPLLQMLDKGHVDLTEEAWLRLVGMWPLRWKPLPSMVEVAIQKARPK